MVIRLSTLLLRLLAWLLTLVVVGVAVVGAILLTGPVSLPWLSPYIERALTGEDVAAVTVGDTQVRLGEGLEFAAVDVRAVDAEGEVLYQLAEIQFVPSWTALLRDRVFALARVEVVAPRLFLTRRKDGSFGLGSRPGIGTTEPLGERIDARVLVQDFLALPGPDDAAHHLEEVRVSGGRLFLEDAELGRALEAGDAEIVLERRAKGTIARLDFQVEQAGAPPATVHAVARHETEAAAIEFSVAVEHLQVAGLAGLFPTMPLDGIDLVVDGRVAGVYDLDRTEQAPVGFELAAARGVVDLPGLLAGPLPIDRMQLRGQLAPGTRIVTIDDLLLRSGEARLTGSAEAGFGAEGPTLEAKLTATDVSARDLKLYWPPGAEPMARRWVVENITDGVVPVARATIRLEPGDVARKPKPEHVVEGEFDFRDLTVRYLDTMPPLVGLAGTASFTGRRMDFTVAGGGIEDLRVQDGTVVITGMGLPGRDTTQLEIRVTVDGPIAQALALLDRPPLGYAGELGIVPTAASGDTRTELAVGMPLHRDFDAADIRVAADATLRDAAIDDLRGGIDLTDGQFELRVDRVQAHLQGPARLDGIPVDLDWTEYFADDAAPARRYRLEGPVGADDLARLGLDVPATLDGSFGLLAEVEEQANALASELTLDLTPLAIDAPGLGWHKGAGEPGRIEASVTRARDGPLEVGAFRATAAGLEAEGRLRLRAAPMALEEIALDRVRLGASEAAVDLRRGTSGALTLAIDGRVAATDLPRFGVAPPVGLDGSFGVVANGTDEAGALTAELALDLTGLAIEAAALGWRKAAEAPGRLTASLTRTADGPVEVAAFTLTATDLAARGSLRFGVEPPTLEDLRLDDFRLGPSTGTARLRRMADGGLTVRVDAGHLDVDALRSGRARAMADDVAAESALVVREAGAPRVTDDHPRDRGDEAEPSELELELVAQSLVFGGTTFSAVDLSAARDRDGWQTARVRGELPGGGEVFLALSPDVDGHHLELTAEDAGAVLRVLDPDVEVRDGSLTVDATIARQRPDWRITGDLVAREFTLNEAPLLARLLTVASPTGIANLVSGQGIFFDELALPFALDGSVLTITGGRMHGSQLGLTFEGTDDLESDRLDLRGTIVPVYALNRLLGILPLVGDTSGSAFAATYTIRGPVEDPDIDVNKVSVLAPGFVRELLSSIWSQSLPAPEVRPSDD